MSAAWETSWPMFAEGDVFSASNDNIYEGTDEHGKAYGCRTCMVSWQLLPSMGEARKHRHEERARVPSSGNGDVRLHVHH